MTAEHPSSHVGELRRLAAAMDDVDARLTAAGVNPTGSGRRLVRYLDDNETSPYAASQQRGGFGGVASAAATIGLRHDSPKAYFDIATACASSGRYTDAWKWAREGAVAAERKVRRKWFEDLRDLVAFDENPPFRAWRGHNRRLVLKRCLIDLRLSDVALAGIFARDYLEVTLEHLDGWHTVYDRFTRTAIRTSEEQRVAAAQETLDNGGLVVVEEEDALGEEDELPEPAEEGEFEEVRRRRF